MSTESWESFPHCDCSASSPFCKGCDRMAQSNKALLDLVPNALNSGLQIWASVKFDESFYCKSTVL